MSDLVLFWHRRDLRLSDNVGLTAASQESNKLVGVFCLDPKILTGDRIAPARIKYMIGCLRSLQQHYAEVGSQLFILHDSPSDAIPKFARAIGAKTVFWNRDVEPYARQRDREVADALKQTGIPFKTCWDLLLHAPGEIHTQSGDPYKVYTPFWKNWKLQAKAEPYPAPSHLEGLNDRERETANNAGAIALPSAKDLGYTWDDPLLLEPGETAATDRLNEFCDTAIWDYREQRNFPAIDGTSRLSAALKFGAIGIRTVWNASAEVFNQCRSDEARDNVQTWQQELAWREFYAHAMYFFPELAEGPYRSEWQDFPWENNSENFQAWCEGRTGYPIVDAAMRQLNQTGWMHNRCRMIVASFLTKDLIIDWRWGEQYFMQTLFDGDLCSNNGGWQWSASSGMDPKPLRIFNPASQAQKFDPEAEYIRQWLPELSSVETEYLVTGKIPVGDREAADYPAPIVDHKQRQREFKALYKQQKAKK